MRRRDLLAAFSGAPWLLEAQTSQRSAADAGIEGRRLLQLMQKALGGTERLAAIRDVDWTIVAKTWDAAGAPAPDGTRRIRWIRPSIFRKDQQVGTMTVLEFFDGSGGWEFVPDGGLLDLKNQELEIVRREATGFWLNILLADRDSRFRVAAAGDHAIRITSGADSSVGTDIEVDGKSHLPVRTHAAPLSGTVTTTYQRVRQRMEYIEWQTVDGVRWPHKTINLHDDVKRAEITTTKLLFNSGLRLEELSSKPRV